MAVKYTKNYNNNTPSWEAILDNFNEAREKNSRIKHNNLDFFVTLIAEEIPEVKTVLQNLNLSFAHSYINLSRQGGTFGNHKDDTDVWFWQVKGKTQWIVENIIYELEEGDLIYVPAGIYHEVIPLGPRCGISMSKK